MRVSPICGLVGIMGNNLGYSEAKAMEWLLHLDATRGKDSTGVAVAKKHGAVELYKEVGPPDFLYKKFPDKFHKGRLILHDVNMVMGHNRWATQGVVNENNAHPFNFTNIVGAHNGTVPLYSLRDFPGHKHFHIDSQIIYSHLDEGPLQDLWDKADGAMALTWWDKNTKELNMVRNKERPLCYAITPDQSTLIWGSEDWFIWLACGRNGIKLGEGAVVSLEEDVHHKFSIKEGKIEVDKIKLTPFKKPTTTIIHRGTTDLQTISVNDKYHAEDFFIEEWTPYAFGKDKNGKRVEVSGWFSGSTFDYELIKVRVMHIDDQIRKIIERLNQDDMWCAWHSKKVELKQHKKSKQWFNYIEHWSDVSLDYDPRDHISESKVISLLDYAPKALPKPETPQYAKMFNYMIPKDQWEKNVNKANGCAQCGNHATWEDRNIMKWWYHGPDLVYDCPTCVGSYN